MIVPFVIMTGTCDGTLSKKSLIGMVLARSYFIQSIGWRKTDVAFSCIGCIHSIQVKNRLIWDAVYSYFFGMVQYKANKLNITLDVIPPGCISLIQINNLIVNKVIKQTF